MISKKVPKGKDSMKKLKNIEAERITNVTLDAKALPALPEPFTDHYISVQKVFASETLSKDQKIKLCRECGIGCSEITASISDGVKEAIETAIHDTNAKVLK